VPYLRRVRQRVQVCGCRGISRRGCRVPGGSVGRLLGGPVGVECSGRGPLNETA
jgi:hypothetical protein